MLALIFLFISLKIDILLLKLCDQHSHILKSEACLRTVIRRRTENILQLFLFLGFLQDFFTDKDFNKISKLKEIWTNNGVCKHILSNKYKIRWWIQICCNTVYVDIRVSLCPKYFLFLRKLFLWTFESLANLPAVKIHYFPTILKERKNF